MNQQEIAQIAKAQHKPLVIPKKKDKDLISDAVDNAPDQELPIEINDYLSLIDPDNGPQMQIKKHELKVIDKSKPNTKSKKLRTTIYLSDHHEEKLRMHLAKKRQSRSNWIEEAIDFLIPD